MVGRETELDGPSGTRTTPSTFRDRTDAWVPEWGQRVRAALLAKRLPTVPIWVVRDLDARFWGEVWGVRLWSGPRVATDIFIDADGAVWSNLVEPRFMFATDGVIEVADRNGNPIPIRTSEGAFVLHGGRPTRADRGAASRRPGLLEDAGDAILASLRGPLHLSGGMLIVHPR